GFDDSAATGCRVYPALQPGSDYNPTVPVVFLLQLPVRLLIQLSIRLLIRLSVLPILLPVRIRLLLITFLCWWLRIRVRRVPFTGLLQSWVCQPWVCQPWVCQPWVC